MNNQLRLFNEGARQALAAGESVQFFLLDLLHHVDEKLQQLPPPPGTELDPSLNLQPHNEHVQHRVTIYDYVQTNLSMTEARKQQIHGWITKFSDLCIVSNIEAEIFLHGSIFQGTAITGSDCDISLRFADSHHLEDVLHILQANKHSMNLQNWIGIVGKACPTIKCKTGSDISIDITDGRQRQQSLCTSYFIREILAKRPDAAIFIKIVKQFFMNAMFYGGAKQCLGGIAFSILILRGLQYIGVLPAFGRFDFGEFGNLNAMCEQYWQANEVQASTADDTKDETLYSRFILILEWIIQTRLSEAISLGPNDNFQNPGVAAVVIFAPPNDYTNVASLVTASNRDLWMLSGFKKLLAEWQADPMKMLQRIA
uniref:Polymerase nucleotidyl transferase domain-containing protein n=1 Tax=Panagrolaimus davidi TaxID=227884 RepID=A0A914PCD7_9BILA